LFVLGLPFALTWGVFGALMRFIPYAGAWVAASVPVLVSLAVFDGWVKPLLIVGLFAATEAIIAFILEPLFFARSAGVSSIALLISVAFWTWLWGPIGLALAIPLTVWLVVFSHTIKGLEFIGILVDDDPGFAPHVIFYQRALAGDAQEAAELVAEAVKSGSDLAAYDSILVPALARARGDHRELRGRARARAPFREAAPRGVSGECDRRRMLGASGLGEAPSRPLRGGRRRCRHHAGPGAERPAPLDAGAGAGAHERQ